MDYEKCSTKTKDLRIVVRENKSRFEVLNPSRLTLIKIEVDGCLITDGRERCDWIISIEEPSKRVMYVELKGCGVDKAISQLKSTLEYTKSQYKDYKKECYAVTSKIPKHGSSTRKKCIDFYKSTKSTLNIKNLNTSVAAWQV